MTRELPLFEAANRPAKAARSGGGFLGWLPLLASLVLFVQLCFGGLRPAIAERARLDRAEALLLERADLLDAEAERLTRRLEAQRDPVYLERERRRRADPAQR